MNILLATYWPFPHIGGVSTYLNILRSRLAEAGHEVEILAQHPGLAHYYLVRGGLRLWKQDFLPQAEEAVKARFRRRKIPLSPWMLWRESEKYAFELACRGLPLQDYDLIHTQDIISTFVLRKAKPGRVPLVATIHGCLATEWAASNEIQARSPLEQHYLSLEEYYGSMSPDGLILPSRWLSGRLSTFGIRHPRAYIIPYGLNQEAYRDRQDKQQMNLRVSSSVRPNKIIACPARLVAIKGQKYLIDAMKLLVQKRSDVVCWLIGDGMMRQDLERQTKELGLEKHVIFWGKRHDVPELIEGADVVVLPSLQDNLPFTIIEAHSLGKPVVASRTGGIVEMVQDWVNGLLAEPGNAVDLYEKLLRLVEDDRLREKQSAEARKHALTVWNDMAMLGQTFEVYGQATVSRPLPLLRQDFVSRLSDDYWANARLAAGHIRNFSILSGTVADAETGLPLPDTPIHLLDTAGVVLRSTASGSGGQFEICDLQPGTYELALSHPQAGLKTRKIAVLSAESTRIDISL
ncbi:MAG: glycosyltransferase [Paenibacillus macerans]|uniref:glycosyltransferase n=1 Tax=Paenibacillus TaxID=44249 RepID=UPI0029120099|nr:glycosyltransferase [Paenibacillus macerans]MDU7475242.1 glycosyltransferase [Paenibacillus macerans]